MIVACTAKECRYNDKESGFCTLERVMILNGKQSKNQKSRVDGNYTWCASYKHN